MPRKKNTRAAKHADWAFHASDAAVLAALARGRHKATLREYFGAPAHAELTALAGAPRRAQGPRSPRVLILPGIMGSRLGAGAEMLWIDPLRIASGRLTALALPSARALKTKGVLLFSYARLKLELEAAGCVAGFHAYDWRLGIQELGAALARRIAAEKRPVVVVAHSMGGLVARAAAAELPQRLLRRLIMLGTPHHGSFAPVQALRGSYPFVRKMATLDRRNSPEYLAERVFCSFPGLYQMLPTPRRFKDSPDLFDARVWPADAPAPNAQLLSEAARVRRTSPGLDSRMVQIIGVNQQTVVGLRRGAAGFRYAMNLNGDGTVPLASARAAELPCYFVDAAHADLPNDPRVIKTVLDLVLRGASKVLPRHWRARPGPLSYVDDATLRLEGNEKVDWRRLNAAQREAVFAALDSGRLLPAAEHPLA